MDGARMQDKLNRGYAKAASKIGFDYRQYRPQVGLAALDEAGFLAVLKASFDANANKYSLPQTFGKPVWTGLWNGALTRPGDYLTDGTTTFFIASQRPLLPMQAVECNATVSLHRPSDGPAPEPDHGYQEGYGGDVQDNEQSVSLLYPCSLLGSGRSESTATGLPSEGRSDQGMSVILPLLPGDMHIELGDVLREQDGTRYLVTGVEWTRMGWRLNAVQTTV